MAGLYFHIPFCRRICAYCDFHRFADLRLMEETVGVMHRELDDSRDFLHDRTLKTIYFGGGTPSLVEPSQLQRLIDHAARIYDASAVEETTVEVNPDDVNPRYIEQLRTTSVNRISLGIQSFDDRLLRMMNRRHDSRQAGTAVKMLQDAGYGNITVDLIFGFESFGDDAVAADLQKTAMLGVQHVSAYHLTVEPGTRFGRMAARGEFAATSDERSERLFVMIHDRLAEEGFEHYEVSNYAREGFRARHNSSYWSGAEYLGIGAGAHSFNGEVRRWCVQNPAEYIAGRRYESETLTERDRLNELIMTSLRRVEGLDSATVSERFGPACAERLLREAAAAEGYGVVVEKGRIRIPPERMLVSDAVIEMLFEV